MWTTREAIGWSVMTELIKMAIQHATKYNKKTISMDPIYALILSLHFFPRTVKPPNNGNFIWQCSGQLDILWRWTFFHLNNLQRVRTSNYADSLPLAIPLSRAFTVYSISTYQIQPGIRRENLIFFVLWKEWVKSGKSLLKSNSWILLLLFKI